MLLLKLRAKKTRKDETVSAEGDRNTPPTVAEGETEEDVFKMDGDREDGGHEGEEAGGADARGKDEEMQDEEGEQSQEQATDKEALDQEDKEDKDRSDKEEDKPIQHMIQGTAATEEEAENMPRVYGKGDDSARENQDKACVHRAAQSIIEWAVKEGIAEYTPALSEMLTIIEEGDEDYDGNRAGQEGDLRTAIELIHFYTQGNLTVEIQVCNQNDEDAVKGTRSIIQGHFEQDKAPIIILKPEGAFVIVNTKTSLEKDDYLEDYLIIGDPHQYGERLYKVGEAWACPTVEGRVNHEETYTNNILVFPKIPHHGFLSKEHNLLETDAETDANAEYKKTWMERPDEPDNQPTKNLPPRHDSKGHGMRAIFCVNEFDEKGTYLEIQRWGNSTIQDVLIEAATKMHMQGARVGDRKYRMLAVQGLFARPSEGAGVRGGIGPIVLTPKDGPANELGLLMPGTVVIVSVMLPKSLQYRTLNRVIRRIQRLGPKMHERTAEKRLEEIDVIIERSKDTLCYECKRPCGPVGCLQSDFREDIQCHAYVCANCIDDHRDSHRNSRHEHDSFGHLEPKINQSFFRDIAPGSCRTTIGDFVAFSGERSRIAVKTDGRVIPIGSRVLERLCEEGGGYYIITSTPTGGKGSLVAETEGEDERDKENKQRRIKVERHEQHVDCVEIELNDAMRSERMQQVGNILTKFIYDGEENSGHFKHDLVRTIPNGTYAHSLVHRNIHGSIQFGQLAKAYATIFGEGIPTSMWTRNWPSGDNVRITPEETRPIKCWAEDGAVRVWLGGDQPVEWLDQGNDVGNGRIGSTGVDLTMSIIGTSCVDDAIVPKNWTVGEVIKHVAAANYWQGIATNTGKTLHVSIGNGEEMINLTNHLERWPCEFKPVQMHLQIHPPAIDKLCVWGGMSKEHTKEAIIFIDESINELSKEARDDFTWRRSILGLRRRDRGNPDIGLDRSSGEHDHIAIDPQVLDEIEDEMNVYSVDVHIMGKFWTNTKLCEGERIGSILGAVAKRWGWQVNDLHASINGETVSLNSRVHDMNLPEAFDLNIVHNGKLGGGGAEVISCMLKTLGGRSWRMQARKYTTSEKIRKAFEREANIPFGHTTLIAAGRTFYAHETIQERGIEEGNVIYAVVREGGGGKKDKKKKDTQDKRKKKAKEDESESCTTTENEEEHQQKTNWRTEKTATSEGFRAVRERDSKADSNKEGSKKDDTPEKQAGQKKRGEDKERKDGKDKKQETEEKASTAAAAHAALKSGRFTFDDGEDVWVAKKQKKEEKKKNDEGEEAEGGRAKKKTRTEADDAKDQQGGATVREKKPERSRGQNEAGVTEVVSSETSSSDDDDDGSSAGSGDEDNADAKYKQGVWGIALFGVPKHYIDDQIFEMLKSKFPKTLKEHTRKDISLTAPLHRGHPWKWVVDEEIAMKLHINSGWGTKGEWKHGADVHQDPKIIKTTSTLKFMDEDRTLTKEEEKEFWKAYVYVLCKGGVQKMRVWAPKKMTFWHLVNSCAEKSGLKADDGLDAIKNPLDRHVAIDWPLSVGEIRQDDGRHCMIAPRPRCQGAGKHIIAITTDSGELVVKAWEKNRSIGGLMNELKSDFGVDMGSDDIKLKKGADSVNSQTWKDLGHSPSHVIRVTGNFNGHKRRGDHNLVQIQLTGNRKTYNFQMRGGEVIKDLDRRIADEAQGQTIHYQPEAEAWPHWHVLPKEARLGDLAAIYAPGGGGGMLELSFEDPKKRLTGTSIESGGNGNEYQQVELFGAAHRNWKKWNEAKAAPRTVNKNTSNALAAEREARGQCDLNDSDIRLYISSEKGRMPIVAKPTCTALDLKRTASWITGESTKHIELWRGSEKLQKMKFLGAYGFKQGTTITAVDTKKVARGETWDINIPCDGDDGDIRQALSQSNLVSPHLQKLVFKRKEIKDGDKIADLGIAAGDIIYFVLKIEGGGRSRSAKGGEKSRDMKLTDDSNLNTQNKFSNANEHLVLSKGTGVGRKGEGKILDEHGHTMVEFLHDSVSKHRNISAVLAEALGYDNEKISVIDLAGDHDADDVWTIQDCTKGEANIVEDKIVISTLNGRTWVCCAGPGACEIDLRECFAERTGLHADDITFVAGGRRIRKGHYPIKKKQHIYVLVRLSGGGPRREEGYGPSQQGKGTGGDKANPYSKVSGASPDKSAGTGREKENQPPGNGGAAEAGGGSAGGTARPKIIDLDPEIKHGVHVKFLKRIQPYFKFKAYAGNTLGNGFDDIEPAVTLYSGDRARAVELGDKMLHTCVDTKLYPSVLVLQSTRKGMEKLADAMLKYASENQTVHLGMLHQAGDLPSEGESMHVINDSPLNRGTDVKSMYTKIYVNRICIPFNAKVRFPTKTGSAPGNTAMQLTLLSTKPSECSWTGMSSILDEDDEAMDLDGLGIGENRTTRTVDFRELEEGLEDELGELAKDNPEKLTIIKKRSMGSRFDDPRDLYVCTMENNWAFMSQFEAITEKYPTPMVGNPEMLTSRDMTKIEAGAAQMRSLAQKLGPLPSTMITAPRTVMVKQPDDALPLKLAITWHNYEARGTSIYPIHEVYDLDTNECGVKKYKIDGPTARKLGIGAEITKKGIRMIGGDPAWTPTDHNKIFTFMAAKTGYTFVSDVTVKQSEPGPDGTTRPCQIFMSEEDAKHWISIYDAPTKMKLNGLIWRVTFGAEFGDKSDDKYLPIDDEVLGKMRCGKFGAIGDGRDLAAQGGQGHDT